MSFNKITVPVARKNVGLTQNDLPELCGVSVSTVGNRENDTSEPTVSQAKKIAQAVGLGIDDLIFLP